MRILSSHWKRENSAVRTSNDTDVKRLWEQSKRSEVCLCCTNKGWLGSTRESRIAYIMVLGPMLGKIQRLDEEVLWPRDHV